MVKNGTPVQATQPRIDPKMLAQMMARNRAQLQPTPQQQSVSSTEGGTGFAADTPLGELGTDAISSFGSSDALTTIAEIQPDTTLGELGPLLQNESALESIAGLLQDRSDLRVSDFISTDLKGRVSIDPSYKDSETMDLLKERPDLKPGDLTAMRQNMARSLRSPQMGQMAAERGYELLKSRPDLTPEDVGNLMDTMMRTMGAGQNNQGGQGNADPAFAGAALDMFDSAAELMTKRSDIGPDQVGELAKTVARLGPGKDAQGAQSISEGFEAAAQAIEKNPLLTTEAMGRTAETVSKHLPGGKFPMKAFKQSSEMMGESSSVDHNSLDKMFTQATQRDPRIANAEGAGKAKRLSQVMDGVFEGVKEGTVPANDLSAHFRNQDAERARFTNKPPKAEDKKDGKKPQAGKPQGEGKKSENSGVLTGAQKDELEATGPPAQPGQGIVVDSAASQDLGPGQAAGTTEAGTQSITPGVQPQTEATGGTVIRRQPGRA